MRREIGRVGEVLYEIASGGDVEELHAAADAEHRETAPARLDEERELEGVAPLLLGAGLGVGGRGAVQVDSEIGPADQAQPVDRVEHLPRFARSFGSRGQHERKTPGEPHAFDVPRGNECHGELPVRPARVGPVRAETDPRPSHYSRSKLRCSSQSVTARSNWSCSTRPACR